MMHDDGCVIQGNHPYVPEGYFMQHSKKCEFCDWHNMGLIKYDCSKFDVVKDVIVDYDRYGGGFMFIHYTNTLTDKNGHMSKNDLLDEWIENISQIKKQNSLIEE
jgi:hypothetical protein